MDKLQYRNLSVVAEVAVMAEVVAVVVFVVAKVACAVFTVLLLLYILEIPTATYIYIYIYIYIVGIGLNPRKCEIQDGGHNTGSNVITACRQVSKEVPAAKPMFQGLSIRIGLLL